jgi:hypothetical protein
MWRTFGVIVLLIGVGLAYLRQNPLEEPTELQMTTPAGHSSDEGSIQLTQEEGAAADPVWSPSEHQPLPEQARPNGAALVRTSTGGDERAATLQLDAPSVAHQSDLTVYPPAGQQHGIWRIDFTPMGQQAANSWNLIASEHDEREPRISPDGRRVLFTSTRSGSRELWMCTRDGLDPVQLTSYGEGAVTRPRWSPDGRAVGFNRIDGTGQHLVHMAVEDGAPQPIAVDHENTRMASWSRDGQWIYFGSDESGYWDLWRANVTSDEVLRVTEEGAAAGFETPDGRYLLYTRMGQRGLWRLPLPLQPLPAEGEQLYLAFPVKELWDINGVVDAGVLFLQKRGREARIHAHDGDQLRLIGVAFDWPENGFTMSPANDMLLYDGPE